MHPAKQTDFMLLADSHRSLIFSIIHKYCKDENYFDDLHHDILLRAWDAYIKTTSIQSFKSWICRIAINTSIDRLRRLKQNIINIANDNYFYCIPDEPYKEERLPIIDTLSKTERSTLDMVLAGMSYKEISAKTGEPINRITVRMHRIKERLSKIKHNNHVDY